MAAFNIHGFGRTHGFSGARGLSGALADFPLKTVPAVTGRSAAVVSDVDAINTRIAQGERRMRANYNAGGLTVDDRGAIISITRKLDQTIEIAQRAINAVNDAGVRMIRFWVTSAVAIAERNVFDVAKKAQGFNYNDAVLANRYGQDVQVNAINAVVARQPIAQPAPAPPVVPAPPPPPDRIVDGRVAPPTEAEDQGAGAGSGNTQLIPPGSTSATSSASAFGGGMGLLLLGALGIGAWALYGNKKDGSSSDSSDYSNEGYETNDPNGPYIDTTGEEIDPNPAGNWNHLLGLARARRRKRSALSNVVTAPIYRVGTPSVVRGRVVPVYGSPSSSPSRGGGRNFASGPVPTGNGTFTVQYTNKDGVTKRSKPMTLVRAKSFSAMWNAQP